ncbi:hypothetical protein ABKV19_011491 [Rosa sericea]
MASKQIKLATFLEVPIEEDRTQRSRTTTFAHQTRALTISPVSSRHNGSTLYDSFELRAVTQQLHRAIQGSKASTSPLYMHCFNSPLYRESLYRMRKESVKTPKRILCSQVSCSTTCDRKSSPEPTKGFVSRAWNKVKQGLVRNKQRNK